LGEVGDELAKVFAQEGVGLGLSELAAAAVGLAGLARGGRIRCRASASGGAWSRIS